MMLIKELELANAFSTTLMKKVEKLTKLMNGMDGSKQIKDKVNKKTGCIARHKCIETKNMLK